jgi:AcrR family transcriptional regulator
MPRVRSDSYDAKAQAIMDSAAAVFAKVGYPNAKMQDVAKACGATKSMLYHYYPTKDDLAFAMLQEHLQKLLGSLEEAATQPGSATERLQSVVLTYVQKSAQSRRRHTVAQNDVKYLPKAMQGPIRLLQVKLCDLIAQLLQQVNPGLPKVVYKPYAMLLIGMLNSTDFWYRTSGPIKSAELCERISRLFLQGFMTEKPAP